MVAVPTVACATTVEESVREQLATAFAPGEQDADVCVTTTGTLTDAARARVEAGAGLVLLTTAPTAATDEPLATVRSASAASEDLLARVDLDALRPVGAIAPADAQTTVLQAGGAPVLTVAELGAGRVVSLAVAVDGPAGARLLDNAVWYAARRPAGAATVTVPEVVADPAWLRLKEAATALRTLQVKDGSVPERADHAAATRLVGTITSAISELAPRFPYDAHYLAALGKDFDRWAEGGFTVPDFYDSLVAFDPSRERVDGRVHLVVFPMYTQNGNPDRNVEAVLLQVIWPDFIADLEAGDYSNKLFLPIRFLDFTPGYDTNSAVLFPETVAMRVLPTFTWGGIFADREAARFRRVASEAAAVTGLRLPADAARLLDSQALAEETFVMWDLIHDRTHMRGDLPFDPFMIKQRMPFFLYALEEMRCDLTAFRAAVELEAEGNQHARLVQYAIIFDRIFRFALTGTRVRNYDALVGQIFFAWLHKAGVVHWTDNRLSVDWDRVAEPMVALSDAVNDLYWHSIDRPKIAHWLAAYELVTSVVVPHPLSDWARYVAGDRDALPVGGPPKGLTDRVLDDEFPLSMFFEALNKKLGPTVASTSGITAATAEVTA